MNRRSFLKTPLAALAGRIEFTQSKAVWYVTLVSRSPVFEGPSTALSFREDLSDICQETYQIMRKRRA